MKGVNAHFDHVCWRGVVNLAGYKVQDLLVWWHGFACQCGGMVVFEIGMMVLLPWVMGLLINVVVWLSTRSE